MKRECVCIALIFRIIQVSAYLNKSALKREITETKKKHVQSQMNWNHSNFIHHHPSLQSFGAPSSDCRWPFVLSPRRPPTLFHSIIKLKKKSNSLQFTDKFITKDGNKWWAYQRGNGGKCGQRITNMFFWGGVQQRPRHCSQTRKEFSFIVW